MNEIESSTPRITITLGSKTINEDGQSHGLYLSFSPTTTSRYLLYWKITAEVASDSDPSQYFNPTHDDVELEPGKSSFFLELPVINENKPNTTKEFAIEMNFLSEDGYYIKKKTHIYLGDDDNM